MAQVTDSKGQISKSDIIQIKAIQEQPPQVLLTYPLPSSEIIAGTSMLVKARATDDRGVAKVEFYIDGQRYITDSKAPYEFRYLVPVNKAIHDHLASRFSHFHTISVSAIPAIRLNIPIRRQSNMM